MKAVNCHLPDFISTFKRLQMKRPKGWKKYKEPPRTLFLTPRQSLRYEDGVWFKEGPVGVNTLARLTERIAADIPKLRDKKFSNKSLRREVYNGHLLEYECALRDEQKQFRKHQQEDVERASAMVTTIVQGEAAIVKRADVITTMLGSEIQVKEADRLHTEDSNKGESFSDNPCCYWKHF
ncbi:hypothetical protein R1flu_018218 [Riccia fluitans]|uniref:Uncharacterized protein n=1 Tax=Riccia fluitans TaxID=41844 RepID=A0ABD1ZGH5_9MARC